MINLRKELGRLKYLLLEDLPYRGFAKRVPDMRKALWDKVPILPALPQSKGNDVELHMLCGHRDTAMGIFASWSLLRFLEETGKLYVHSDGSLTDDDIEKWSAVIPDLVVVSKEEADRRVTEVLEGTTQHLYRWRCNYGMSAQVVDAHFFGEAQKIVSFDSDVLAFHSPDAFISSVLSSTMEYMWCQDFQDAYSAPRQMFQDVFGIEMPNRFNGGFMVTPRFSLETFQEVDEIMETMRLDGRIDMDHYWSAQTYYAILAARRGLTKMMPPTYDTHKGRTRRSAVVRHYVGVDQIRFRYFTEGIPRLLKQIG
ncbi:MAG: hypothetical protein O3C43_21930 [Verrucomicrobia bacterium]|nr:hypothetical protein [Verrucomicrobiota bacterium]MDA1069155.1 hypothetical protein [Verrucomicrobiota bacterium]